MRRLIFLPALLLLLSLVSPAARGQDETSALINQALDVTLSIVFEEKPLPEAIQELTEATGVPIQVQPVVWDLLPWGLQTTISAPPFENKTLRAVLQSITQGSGLRWVLKEEAIELQPMPALRRLGRRASQHELEALVLVAMNSAELTTDRPTVRQLVEAVDRRLIELNSPFVIEYRAREAVRDDQEVFVPRNATLMAALESLVADTSATWYPWGQSIVIAGKQDQVRRQLARPITRNFEEADLGQVLMELSERSGVRFTIEPGAIQRVPAAARRIKASLENAPIRDVMEHLAGVTGLAFEIRDDGVYIWNQQAAEPPPAAQDPVIAIIPVPEMNLQIPLTASQVPPELREYLEQKVREKLQEIDEMRLEEEAQRNATQPQ